LDINLARAVAYARMMVDAFDNDIVINYIVRAWARLAAVLCAVRFVQAARSIIKRKPLFGAYWWGPIVGIFGMEMAGVAFNFPGPLTYLLARLLP
jgi:hypothetical protein